MNIKILVSILILLIINIFYKFIVKKFKIKDFYYIISFIISTIILLCGNNIDFKFHIYVYIFNILILLAFTDIKYYEIDGKSYYPLIFITFINFCYFLYLKNNILNMLISPIFIYFMFWLFDKIYGIENLGGADVKIIFILSFYYSADKLFSFMMYMFIISFIIFLFKAFKLKRINDIKIPMLVSICLSYLIQGIYFF